MKKTIQKLYLLIAIVAMALFAAGCGGAEKKAEGDIKIGLTGEMTGNNANYGTSTQDGVKLAVKEINAAGGILGKKINLIVVDNKSEPSEAANVMTKLTQQDKVVAAIGNFTSSCAISASNVATSAKIPYVSNGATNPRLTVENGKTKEYIFRACFIDPFQGTVGANFILNTLKLKKGVVLVDNNSDYSKGLTDFFKAAFIKGGGSILGEEGYLQKDQDFRPILTKIRDLKPEFIYLPGYYEEAGKIIKQARELGMNVPVVGGDGWDSAKLAEIAGGAALNNTYFTNHYSPEDKSPASTAFVAAFDKEYKKVPDGPAVLGYDTLKLVADAIKRANSTDPAKIRDALAATKNFPGAAGTLTINETHDATKSAVIIEMKNGKQVYKETVKP
ncbi:MAG: ABC transporter substrate-binding protein [Acidaminococcales bacterium]|jgi:branched-chain amino acid transport system substrate-binding protein|nr:ABC transporter substrate-binding protein [Acidaminococcales bacterium]